MRKLFAMTSFLLFVLSISCNQTKNWEDVKRENSLADYEEFLLNNPETEHKDSIILLIRELDWQIAKSEKTIDALDAFKLKYTDYVEYTDSIYDLKVEIEWAQVVNTNTLEAYMEYQKNHPMNKNRKEAERMIEILRWNKVKTSKNNQEIINFLSEHSNNYLDSLDVKFEFKDFEGYQVTFITDADDQIGNIHEELILNFNPNKTLTGVYEGNRNSNGKDESWRGKIRGHFDLNGFTNIEKRPTELGFDIEYETGEWTKFQLGFDKEQTTLSNENRTYHLDGISWIRTE